MTSDASTFDRIAAPYDRGMAVLERFWLRRMRARLVPLAAGRVLEVGVGTGVNFRFYPPSTCVTAVDESPDMLAVAALRARTLGHSAHFGQMDAEHLGFPAGYFDTVLASLVLCSVIDQPRALAELKRVLKQPGGRLLLLEHMRPQNRPLSWLTDLANVPWYALNGRCHLNRETHRAVVNAGFQVDREESIVGGFVRLIVGRTV
jgi:ubiquinone/menaquinone biosynthesis C-methylase UbiE